MVDFNSEGAFTANKAHILELVILGRRDELINTFQLWREHKLAGDSQEEGLKRKLRAVLFALFLEIERPLERKFIEKEEDLDASDDKRKRLKERKERYDAIKKTVLSVDGDVQDEKLVEVFQHINGALDEMNLIRIDNKRRYDTTDIEAENAEKGM